MRFPFLSMTSPRVRIALPRICFRWFIVRRDLSPLAFAPTTRSHSDVAATAFFYVNLMPRYLPPILASALVILAGFLPLTPLVEAAPIPVVSTQQDADGM